MNGYQNLFHTYFPNTYMEAQQYHFKVGDHSFFVISLTP